MKFLPNTHCHTCHSHSFVPCPPLKSSIARPSQTLHNMAPPGIDHPSFTWISNTLYMLCAPEAGYKKLLHIGQIMAYLSFDQYIRKHGGLKISSFPGIPISYLNFTLTFNSGKHSGDSREVFICIIDSQEEEVTPATGPAATLSDFHICPEHCGFPPLPPIDTVPKEYAMVIEQFAIQTATSNKHKEEFFEKTEAK